MNDSDRMATLNFLVQLCVSREVTVEKSHGSIAYNTTKCMLSVSNIMATMTVIKLLKMELSYKGKARQDVVARCFAILEAILKVEATIPH